MKKSILLMLLVSLALSTVSSAEVLREIWWVGANIDQAIALVNSGTPADQIDILDEPTWVDIADNYVARMSGWLTIPATGEYTFYVSGDDYQRLYVSQDDNPANAEMVAFVDGWTASQEWTKYASQKAQPMMLQEGQVLAVYGIMQEGGGGDGQDWGWTGPGVEAITLIPGDLFVIDYEVTAPAKARVVTPADGATGVIDAVANWYMPDGAEGVVYDLYVGIDPDNLFVFAEGIVETTVLGGTAGIELDFGTTYYWRVDADGTPGRVWSFTTEAMAFAVPNIIATSNGTPQEGSEPAKAVDGRISTEATDQWLATPPEGEVLWIQFELPRVHKMYDMAVFNSNTQFEALLGYGAKDVTIEYSADGDAWEVFGDVELARAAETTINLDGIGARFIRLTINSNWGGLFADSGLTEVRMTYVPAYVRFPSLADGATGVDPDVVLSWQAGRGAVAHNVYVGTDELALAGVVAGNSFAPDLVYGMPYYWKVDADDGAAIWEGDVLSFTTREFDTIASGLILEYDNSIEPFYSEVALTAEDGMDLAAYGASTLRVAFRGATKDAADIYVAIEDMDGQVAVIPNPTPTMPAAPGLLREIWWGDASIDEAIALVNSGVPANQMDVLEEPTWVDIADNYVARMSGWLTIPATGEYTFYVAGDDSQRMYVSQDDNPANAVLVAYVDGWTASQAWTTYASQKAEPMMLEEGQVLAVYGIMQEGGGGDGQDFGWTGPGFDEVTVIPGEYWTHSSPQTWNLALGDIAGVDLANVASLAIGAGNRLDPAADGAGVIMVNSISIGTPISHNVLADVTGPGDAVQGVPNDGDWPGGEHPALAIDNNVATKFLHFKGDEGPSGICVTPAVGPTVVTGLTLTTANDVPGRDPITFELYGSNDGIDGPYTLIASGDILDFAGEVEWPRFTKNATPITFENDVVYTSYQLLFPDIRGPVGGSVNSMQIAEIELIGVASW